MRKNNGLFVLLCSAIVFSFNASAQVDVSINNVQYHYEQPPRLADVLAPMALEAAWYWPGASLYRLDTKIAEQQRDKTLALIARITKDNIADTELVAAMAQLKRQIAAWPLAEKIPVAIDYDYARVSEAQNPRFDAGVYALHLSKRPGNVTVFGAVKRDVTVVHQGAAPAADYLAHVELTANAFTDSVILLQPDGKQQNVGVAYWNKQVIEAMPGAQIFIPFKPQWLNDDFEQLNQQLRLLAQYRMLP